MGHHVHTAAEAIHLVAPGSDVCEDGRSPLHRCLRAILVLAGSTRLPRSLEPTHLEGHTPGPPVS